MHPISRLINPNSLLSRKQLELLPSNCILQKRGTTAEAAWDPIIPPHCTKPNERKRISRIKCSVQRTISLAFITQIIAFRIPEKKDAGQKSLFLVPHYPPGRNLSRYGFNAPEKYRNSNISNEGIGEMFRISFWCSKSF
ncbi:hypothetical protein CDAR_307401 [Caerostris darwini]|uniref:Uncharacterized protein n=1 Tax=Caerostris darwini TaxID=1538125 RepID=A0AAV4T3Y8_9ARAC|nr:hypothetical protein CDAR_307401 [Caerostris darwini]